MSKLSFKGCKYLIFNKNEIDKRFLLVEIPQTKSVYWKRDKSLLPNESCAENVQFCRKRGRLDGKFCCVFGQAECHLYDEIVHVVDLSEKGGM